MPEKKISGPGGNLAEKSADIVRKAADKTMRLAKIAKIKTEIMAEKDKVRRVQMEIGKIYYETYKNTPHEELCDSCNDIRNSLASIAEKRRLIEGLKTGVPEMREDEDIFEE